MKFCPNCQMRYTDDTLRFCLQDGTPLVADAALPTAQLGEIETVVAPRAVEPLRFDLPERADADGRNQTPTLSTEPLTAAPTKKSKTLPLVLLTAFLTLLLLGAGAAATWLYLKNNRADVGRNAATNAGNQAPEANANVKSNVKITPAPTVSPKNENSSNGLNAVNFNASTPAPNVDREQIKEEVADRIDDWKSLTEARNLNDYMNYYADTIDYYNKRGVNASYVRADKQRAFGDFDAIEMNVSNLSVTPDATGARATAVFDKEWFFDGAEKSSSGKVKTELQLKKINGKWLIVSERDLKIYYTE